MFFPPIGVKRVRLKGAARRCAYYLISNDIIRPNNILLLISEHLVIIPFEQIFGGRSPFTNSPEASPPRYLYDRCRRAETANARNENHRAGERLVIRAVTD